MRVIDYVIEEVSRQGHDVEVLDGIERVGWMLNAWAYALREAAEGRRPTMADAREMGCLIERRRNKIGWRRCGVRVGSRLCPDFNVVPDLLDALFARRDQMTPIEFYKEFELVHPFVDGNGRTGKILLNWLNGTLGDPVFPPADLFGHPIRNP